MTTASDTRVEPAGASEASPGSHPAFLLRGVLVEYDGRPGRRTISPRAPTRDELLTAWLTADASAFYDLAEVR